MTTQTKTRAAAAKSIAVLSVISLAVAGCTTDESGRSVVRDDVATVGGGAAVGTAIGAGLGALLGGRSGALIGAAIGAGVGTVAGVAVLRTKEQYANDAAMIEQETAQIRAERRDLAAYNDNLENELASLRRERAALRSSGASTEAVTRKAVALRADAEERLKKVEAELRTTASLRGELDDGSSAGAADWRTAEAELTRERDRLRASLDGLSAGGGIVD